MRFFHWVCVLFTIASASTRCQAALAWTNGLGCVVSPSHTCQLSRFHRESHSLGHHLTVKFSNLTANLHSNKIQTLNRSGFRGARGLIAASVAKFRRPSGAFLFLENELSTLGIFLSMDILQAYTLKTVG